MIIDKRLLAPMGLIRSFFSDLINFRRRKSDRIEEKRDSIPIYSADAEISNCEGCNNCLNSCPTNTLFKDDNDRLQLDRSSCLLCGYCVDGCPKKFLQMSDDQTLLVFKRENSIISLER